jgi:predicted solute-binding protein
VVLTELALNGTLHEPGPSATALPDTGDRHLWALLKSAPAVLVTGDEALRRRAPDPARVLSPRQFLARL